MSRWASGRWPARWPQRWTAGRSGTRGWLVLAGVVAGVVVAGVAVVLTGPGSGLPDSSAVASSSPAAPYPGLGPDTGADGSAGPEESAASQSAPTATKDGDRAALAGADQGQELPTQGVAVGGVQRSLVRTAQLTVEVDDAAAASRQVRAAAAAAGAVVVQEQAGRDGAWLVLRVPADALDRLVDAVEGEEVARTSQVVDATEEVVDLDARVASQQASVARVRTLLAQATTISEIVSVESELARREADLDSLTSRLASLRDQVALSTLTVDLRGPALPPAPLADPAPGFLDGLAAGWAGLRAVGAATAAVVGFVLPFLPVLGLLVAIAWAVRRIARGRRAPAPSGPGPAAAP